MSTQEAVQVSAGPVVSTSMKHLMLDWETMGNKPNAAVIALGACFFDPATGKIGAKFYTDINLQSSVDAGLDIDPSTVLWWMQQSDEARAKFQQNEAAPSVALAMNEFKVWLEGRRTETLSVWGNGVGFDNIIAANVFRKLGFECPWKFFEDRCYRTVKNLYPDVKCEFEGIKHYALDDAIYQAKRLSAIAQKHKILGAV